MGLMTPGGRLKIYTFTLSDFSSNTTFALNVDVKSVPGYERLTVDNFYIVQAGVNPRATTNAGAITRTYDASSGILKVQISAGTSVSFRAPVVIACIIAV